MSRFRPYIDTSFVLALLNARDQYHRAAHALLPRTNHVRKWTSEAVLIEVADGMSRIDRALAIAYISRCYEAPDITVVPLSSDLIQRGFALYRDRPDKSWGLTDCISFVAMREEGLTDALTSDEHFAQAGFRALMREGA